MVFGTRPPGYEPTPLARALNRVRLAADFAALYLSEHEPHPGEAEQLRRRLLRIRGELRALVGHDEPGELEDEDPCCTEDVLLPPLVKWYGWLLQHADPDGRVPVGLAHESALQALGFGPRGRRWSA